MREADKSYFVSLLGKLGRNDVIDTVVLRELSTPIMFQVSQVSLLFESRLLTFNEDGVTPQLSLTS